ncbi:MAG: hypothetical protein EPO32_03690 [Anaerolineae bacterium]|nr:MAG: hypothetical protein EPO32_03690 [Anaerolineae bacterium]
MLKQRTLVTFAALPVAVYATFSHPAVIGLILLAVFAIAAWEYAGVLRAGDVLASRFMVVGGVIALFLARYFTGFTADAWLLPLLTMLAITYHLWRYEHDRTTAATDFLATLGGIFYIGLLGSFFVLIRALPDGAWWLLTTLFGIWLADSGAYLIGIRWGRRKLAPRLSPKKTWEGYIGGILSALVFLPLFVLLFYQFGLTPDSGLTIANTLWLALVLSIFPTLGDLGESMFKRQVGVKDSGHLLPGHGGMFDRVDSWLWGAVLGYFTILWFFL